MAANSIAKLPGELVVAEAHRTQCLIQYTENQESGGKGGGGTAVSGTLSCTNYCFHFEPDAAPGLARLGEYISSQLASSRRVPLGCVREIYMIVGGRKKILEGHATLPKKISEIEIICVDLRRLVFSVKQCPKNEASSILNALVRHTNPSSVSLLFAFDFARATRQRRPSQTNDSAPLFLGARDWQRELTRLGVAGDQWRISDSNKNFLICDSLCPFLVVPANSRDNTLDYVASLHHGNRLPVWCWSHPNTGVSLTRGGAPSIDDPSEAPDPNYMYAVSMARNIGHQIENKGTATLDVTPACGTVWDLRSAFSNMRDLSMPGSSQELAGLDRKWLTGMESAGWLPMVRSCLRLAKTVSLTLCIDHRPVFLQEDGGRDLSCVVSSLAQLMMDPHYRSISGFQALVQKDWVAMGHPFSTRNRLITKPPSLSPDSATDEPSVEAPTFLLFLDCVWQLSLQFPSAFEFSEFYLLQLHSLTYASLYGTFVFNSPKICLQVAMVSRHSQFFGSDEGVPNSTETCYEGLLRPAWGNWRENLTREDRDYCLNPLYYIFGNSEARYDFNTSDPLPMYDQFSSIFDDTAPNLVVGGSYGLYNRDSPMKDLHVAGRGKTSHHYQQGLLLPETSGCSVKPWLGFFARHIPDFQQHFAEQRRVREREVRLVKDVRRLKDTLNELELSVGAITSDLTSFVGTILAARERERRNRMSSLSPDHAHRPRLSAMLEDVDDRGSEVNSSSKTLPTKVQSLAEFSETLYMYSDDRGTPSGRRKLPDGAVGGASPGPGNTLSPGSGRSPITKTRLRVTRTESMENSSLHSRTPGPASGHIPLLANKILIREQNVAPEEEEEEEEKEPAKEYSPVDVECTDL